MDESTLFLRVIAHYAKAFWFMLIALLFFYNTGVVRSWGESEVQSCIFADDYDCASKDDIYTLGMFLLWIGSVIFISKAVSVARIAHEGLAAVEEVAD